jgi:hypothetical protein
VLARLLNLVFQYVTHIIASHDTDEQLVDWYRAAFARHVTNLAKFLQQSETNRYGSPIGLRRSTRRTALYFCTSRRDDQCEHRRPIIACASGSLLSTGCKRKSRPVILSIPVLLYRKV